LFGTGFPYLQRDDIEIQSRFAFRQTKLSLAASLIDHPDIRRVFAGFHIEIVPIQYTVGGGRAAERNELIIFSWDDAAQPVGLF